MKGFVFNLEKLLNLRKYVEQEWEIKLGQAVRKCVDIEKQIKHKKSEIDRMISLGIKEIDDREYLLAMDIYRRRMEQDIINLREKLKKAEEKREEVKVQFLEHSRNRKILSKLKEKRQNEYNKNLLKLEFNEMDEINNSRNFYKDRKF